MPGPQARFHVCQEVDHILPCHYEINILFNHVLAIMAVFISYVLRHCVLSVFDRLVIIVFMCHLFCHYILVKKAWVEVGIG